MTREDFDAAMRAYGRRMHLPTPSAPLLDAYWDYLQGVGLRNIWFITEALDRCVRLADQYEGWAPPAMIFDQACKLAWSSGSDPKGMVA